MVLGLALAMVLAMPVSALDFQAPDPPEQVKSLIPETADSFGEGLWNVIRFGLEQLNTSFHQGATHCLGVVAVSLACSLIRHWCGETATGGIELTGVVTVAGLLLRPTSSLIARGVETAQDLGAYGTLLLPVLTGAMAAQGGINGATALYAATTWMDSLISNFLIRMTKPLLYLYLALALGHRVSNDRLLAQMKEGSAWAMGCGMKWLFWGFSGFLTITGVVTGKVDQYAVQAAKTALSAGVPIMGSILANASETVILTAGTMGSAAGVLGTITVLALFAGPAASIGAQYLLLKVTAGISKSFDAGSVGGMVEDFATAMGLCLAMVSTQTVILMVSTFCLMKGVG